MSSPPYHASPSAHSPPFPSHSQLPGINTVNGNVSNKKRSAGGDASSPASKRRKPSLMSTGSTTSAHPLRQTSFPPDGESSPFGNGSGARSPSVGYNDDNMSTISGAHSTISNTHSNAPLKKKRGRKSKAEKARELAEREGTPSVVGGRAGTAVSGVTGGGRSTVRDEEEDEEDDKDLKTKMGGIAHFERSKEEREEEQRHRQALYRTMDLDQSERFEMWRAAKLSESSVKRLVNATVSQSVPQQVYKAMQSASKVFLGDFIEKALKVQKEWIAKTDEVQAEVPVPEWPYEEDEHLCAGKTNPTVKPIEQPRGPLRPEHLREALRRSKKSGEGGCVGGLGLWNQQQANGVERFGVRTGGRRMFK